jgi:hypothetical protein
MKVEEERLICECGSPDFFKNSYVAGWAIHSFACIRCGKPFRVWCLNMAKEDEVTKKVLDYQKRKKHGN